MTWHTIGSLTLPHQLNRQSTHLRQATNAHALELSTGRVTDPSRHLRGNLAPLAALETRQGRIAAQSSALRQVALRLDAAQTALNRVADLGQQVGGQMSLSATVATAPALATAGRAALSALEDSIAALSVRSAGVAVFAGSNSDRAPLAGAPAFMAAAEGAVAGLTTAADVETALETLFLAPGGGFETTLSNAGQAASAVALADGAPGPVAPTANDRVLRRHLMDLTLGALLTRPLPGLPLSERAALAAGTAAKLASGAADMTGLQGQVGLGQSRLDATQIRLRAEEDALATARLGLIGADPFEAATRLEETRSRLEAVHAVTARLSRLSLLEALR